MKVAVIGAGYWGRKHVAEYAALPGVEVIVCDPFQKNREEVAAKFKVPSLSDPEEVFSDESIRAVSICTPNETHYELCKRALLFGKDVLLEKPLTLSYETSKELVDIAERKGRILFVGHVFRFNNAIQKAKELISAGELGQIYLAELSWTNLEPVFVGRDILFDLSPHAFDILNNLFGAHPSEVSCVGKPFRKPSGEEVAFVHARFGSVLANLNLSWVTPKKRRTVFVVGSKKTLFIDCLSQECELFDQETKTAEKLAVTQNNTLGDELKEFLSCVETPSRYDRSRGRIGAEVVYVIERCRESLERGARVKISLGP